MKILKRFSAAIAAAFMAAIPLSAACSARREEEEENQDILQYQDGALSPDGNISLPNGDESIDSDSGGSSPEYREDEPSADEAPKEAVIAYLKVTSDGVNIRSGAGTAYSVRGQAEKSTLYSFTENSDGWYKTGYRNKTGYISGKYCSLVNMPSSQNELIEAVIMEGCKLLGTPYVYGAVRLHDGRGNMYKSFTADEFDCSSLMQYIFYKGAGKLLDVNTRTQVYQGTTVTKSQLKRGDLMFFTNAQRKNNKGIERIGHVALYLGDNYILHTASDYAKIEQISAARWGYFIQGQRII